MGKASYTNFEGETVEYTYESDLTLSQKTNFVLEVSEMIVSSTVGYASLLRNAIFEYNLIKFFTDIEIFNNPSEFNLDLLEDFCKTNRESVIELVKEQAVEGLIDELSKACDDAIEFRKLHFNDYDDLHSEIEDLLQVVREFVVKPDYMNNVLESLANFLNKASEREIDEDVVNKIAEILPDLKAVNKDNVISMVANKVSKKK